jgi:septal ring factor EnvC (AmiA/AmiB activator)
MRRGTRPLKTRAELEKDLQSPIINLDEAGNALDLVLRIFVESGLVFLLPESPADRYQLVHDYIAAFIRQQQAPQLEKLLADLDAERQRRQQAERALIALEDQKQTAESELQALKAEQDQATQELVTTTKKVKRRSLLGAVALGLAVVAGTAASISIVGATVAERRAERAEASAEEAEAKATENINAAEAKGRTGRNRSKESTASSRRKGASGKSSSFKTRKASNETQRQRCKQQIEM